MDNTDKLSSTQRLSPFSEDSRESCSLLDPKKIGRYTILRRLGRGGFGEVYQGFDDELDRPVAIKVPRPDRISRPEDVEAYLSEARILASLDHPHIVPVFDVGRTEDGLCFVVSKLIDGRDLAVRLGQAKPFFRDSAELVATIAEALHYAHTRGLVHRDIKPSNILVDAAGKPCVADFGLALRDEDFGKGGGLAGTPSYMSPEQARGEGHLVDGRSDIFSLGVVFYELLTGRKPFRAESLPQIIEQVTQAEARPPRQVDDTIPKELERICLKAMSKRASERYTTARDMAEDLRLFLQTTAVTVPPAPPSALISTSPGSTLDAAAPPATSGQSDSDQQPINIVPKGLRSFDEQDADFFLELLPGPRDRDGMPDRIRFWKQRIEQIDPDLTFKVGLIYGPSGCGKSSLVKAGLMPRLGKHVFTVYVEATQEETEVRLLKGVRKACPELSRGLGIVDSLAALRRGRILPPEHKVFLVLDQFEQWLLANRGKENTELVAALRHCDGEHVQAIVLMRDDFWLAASRFMRDLEIRLVEGENSALVDLFDSRHARKVLIAFGRAYGALPEKIRDFTGDQNSFLDQSISGLDQDGKIISVRLALFAEMMKGKPWTPATLREVGGAEGIGLTFLEETFVVSTAPPEHRFHRKAAQAVLKALLPLNSTDIKGQMRSRHELQQASGYANHPREFDDLIRILDRELRLITPTDPEGSTGEGPPQTSSGQYYQLTHDYLVHSLRDWLTRKQRETRRGRAELRLAEQSALWSAKPENRRLPSALEWASIRLLTKSREWSEPQRKMMQRAMQIHGLKTLGLLLFVSLVTLVGIEGYGALRTSALVESLLKVDTPDAPAIVKQLSGYRRWADPWLVRIVRSSDDQSREHLHASLALLAVDATQRDYLFKRLLSATPSELPALRDALTAYRSTLVPKLWTSIESAKPGDAGVLPSASALASYAPDDTRWEAVGGKVALTLVSVNSLLLRPWIEALRPVRGKLTAPIATVFHDKSRSESVHSLATDILTDYASDDPDQLAQLLMVSDPKAYQRLFPIAEKWSEQILPVFQAELAKSATYSWNDTPLNSSWTNPGADSARWIELAQGILAERFAFCQTMPLDEFLTTAETLRKSGYRPIRFRPYADGQVVLVAAVWTRDGLNWRICSGQTSDEIRQQDDRNKKDRFHPVDVAGYLAIEKKGKPTDHFAALWVEGAGDDDVRLYVGMTADEETELQDRLKQAKLIPRTRTAMIGSDGRARYCGVWGRPAEAAITGQTYRDQFERTFEQKQANLSDQLLLDLSINGTSEPQPTRERARAELQSAEQKLKTKPDDLDARLARAVANYRLGQNQQALDDLQVVIGKDPRNTKAVAYRIILLARLGVKTDALAEMARFQKDDAPERSLLYLATVVAAELGENLDKAVKALEAAIQKHPKDADLRYDAARAFALASRAVSRKDTSKSSQLAECSLRLLQEAARNDEADFGKMHEDPDLDPIRDGPVFAGIMRAGYPDRRYAAVWTSDARFEAVPLYALDPTAHLQKCRALVSQDYRMVALSVTRTDLKGTLLTASVWHRPVVTERAKDHLAERQARAAVALVRMDKAKLVWPLLRHSADPRLRSFIVNWLNPLGADPRSVAAELDRIDPNAKTVPAPGQQRMEAILHHPEISMRRALILALGTFGTDRLSPGEREPLIARLLDLYRNDPDAGIHGATKYTLQKWDQQERLRAIDSELARLKDRGERRWFVNSQGQTFAVVDGPVEVRMGSRPTDEDHGFGQPPHQRIIPRRFAVCMQEVTAGQYQEFLKKRTQSGPAPPAPPASLDAENPIVVVTWYNAVAYCNWLSQQEGLSTDDLCYLPADEGGPADGKTIPEDGLKRSGYRLLSEAEWEYACRAGSVTSRYYGSSKELLGNYAWYIDNSQEFPRHCGILLPNDLGLFDMLGNVWEWCQDEYQPYQPGTGKVVDERHWKEHVTIKTFRVMRGASHEFHARMARASYRDWLQPSLIFSDGGFRIAKTLPPSELTSSEAGGTGSGAK